jgi:hypothetical protein
MRGEGRGARGEGTGGGGETGEVDIHDAQDGGDGQEITDSTADSRQQTADKLQGVEGR